MASSVAATATAKVIATGAAASRVLPTALLHDIGVNFGNEKRYTDSVVARLLGEARAAGVACAVSITNNLAELPRNRALAAMHAGLFHTAGVHPHCASEVTTRGELEAQIRAAFATGKCVAIGECGLDYCRNYSPREAQLRCFRWQVEIAHALGKPLYLHCRSKPGSSAAFDDMLRILDECGLPAPQPGVVHCFTGPPGQAAAFCARGLFLGITGWLLDSRRNADLVASVRATPLSRLLVETDAPWMPTAGRKASEPRDVVAVAHEIARLQGVPSGDAEHALAANAAVALGLPLGASAGAAVLPLGAAAPPSAAAGSTLPSEQGVLPHV